MDIIDQAQMYQERDTQIAIQQVLSYKQVEASTGFCEECGEEIHPERVKAINATTCIDCARKEEQRLKKWAI